jgi:hypothetical protein
VGDAIFSAIERPPPMKKLTLQHAPWEDNPDPYLHMTREEIELAINNLAKAHPELIKKGKPQK